MCSLFRNNLYESALWSTKPAYLQVDSKASKTCEILCEKKSNYCLTLCLLDIHKAYESMKGSEKSCNKVFSSTFPPPLSLITISHIYLSRETISICHNLRNITLEKKRSKYHFAPGSCLKLPFSVHIFRCLTLRVLKDRPPSGFACDFLSGPLMLV